MSSVATVENCRTHRAWRTLSLSGACTVCWLAFGITVVAADCFSHDPEWWRFSICAFGVAEKSSAPWLFNAGAVATSMLAVALASRESETLRTHCQRGIVTARERNLIVGATLVLAAQLAVIGLVPYDLSRTAWLVHNFAGWGSGCVLTVGMLAVALASRDLGRRFLAMTWCTLAAVFALFVLFQLGMLPYAVAESAGLVCCAVWTTKYLAELERPAIR